jgi:methylmalonyl-CoA mutase cobalamin-binding domain/chain
MWAKLVKERFQARDPRSWIFRHHSGTLGGNLTAQQPINNIVRVTIEALAAILGGAQSLSNNAMDEVLSIPTQEAAHVALMTQHILAHETGISDVVDPLGGSYYIEDLTNEIETRALKLMEEIRDILNGFPGISSEVVTFLGDRISETITGEVSPVVINVFGDDLDLIDDKAKEWQSQKNGTIDSQSKFILWQ